MSAIVLLLINAATTHAFQILRPTGAIIRTVGGRHTHLGAVSLQSSGSFWISDEMDLATAAAPAEGAISASAFSDQIDYFGDPTVRILFLVFAGVVLLLSGLSIVSQKVDDAIESVIVDFESVLKTDPEFRSTWQDVQVQLEAYDAAESDEMLLKRKQKLFAIMEELQETEPALMSRINSKMEALKN